MSKGGKRENAGRPKGSKNILTTEIKSELNKILEKEVNNIPKLLESIECSAKRIDCIIKLMAYTIPKPKAIIDIDTNNEVKVVYEWPPMIINGKEADI